MVARIQVLEDCAGFTALGPAWAELHSSAQGGPFSSVDWIESWFAAFADADIQPRIGCLWRDGQLVAALPLGIVVRRLAKTGPRFAHLEMLCRDRAGFHDLLAAPGHEDAIPVLARQMLATQNCDILDVTPVRQAGALNALDRGLGRQGYATWPRDEIRAAICEHPDGWDACLARRSRDFRKSLRRAQAALEENEHEVLEAGCPGGGTDQILNRALALSARTWKARLGTDIGSDARTRNFFLQLWKRLSAKGQMKVHLLSIGGCEAASYIALEQGVTSYGLIVDMDERFRAVSPGRVVVCAAIRAAADRGLSETNLLRSSPFIDRLADRFETYGRLRACRRLSQANLWLTAQDLLRPFGKTARKRKQKQTRKRAAFTG